MTRDEVLTLLAYRLGNRTDMQARGLLEMPLVQQQLLEGNAWLPWFLEVDSVGLETVAQTRSVTLPSDFLLESEEGHLWITVDGVRTRLVKNDWDTALARYPETGVPKLYSLTTTSIELFPIPDAQYSLDFKYYGADTDMATANVETKWLKYSADLVLAQLGAILAGKHMQNPQLAQSFQQDVAEAWNRLYAKHIVRLELNQSRAMGANT